MNSQMNCLRIGAVHVFGAADRRLSVRAVICFGAVWQSGWQESHG